MTIVPMLIFAAVASFTPGPNNIMALFFSNTFGLKQTFRFCIGVGFGFFILLLIANYFSNALSTIFPNIELFMRVFGALYLLYLAYKIGTSSMSNEQQFNSKYNSIKAGTLLQFINPKAAVYALTVTGTFVMPHYDSYFTQFMIVILLAVIGFVATFSWSLFGMLFKKLITKYQMAFNIVMALLLVYTAATILFQ